MKIAYNAYIVYFLLSLLIIVYFLFFVVLFSMLQFLVNKDVYNMERPQIRPWFSRERLAERTTKNGRTSRPHRSSIHPWTPLGNFRSQTPNVLPQVAVQRNWHLFHNFLTYLVEDETDKIVDARASS